MGIVFSEFNLNQSTVAPIIYSTSKHRTTNRGIIISGDIRQELKSFLSLFNAFIGVEKIPHYRIDAYFNEQSLWILEINASFVDGWGTALNLARSSGISIDPKLLIFPKRKKYWVGNQVKQLKIQSSHFLFGISNILMGGKNKLILFCFLEFDYSLLA